jgi:hypothetical protein
MKKLVAGGFCIVVVTELVLLLLPDRRFVLWFSGVALGLVLLTMRRWLVMEAGPAAAEPAPDDHTESLRNWLSRTETLIHWSESTRSDWDRRLRPMLARQFEMATGQRHNKDPGAFRATGRMLFGDELWAWVDPNNIARTGGREPGPGRAALNGILQRLEQV